jgi:Tfp pilus assembly protein PilV
MGLTIRLKSLKANHQGSSLPEVLVSSAILATTVLATLQISNSTIQGMGQSKVRAQIDSAIAERIENLRGHAFRYLCSKGEGENSLHPQDAGCLKPGITYELSYGTHDHEDAANHLKDLKDLCKAKGMGEGLLNAINSAYSQNSSANPLNQFTLEGTKPLITIKPESKSEGNQLRVTFTSSPVSTEVTTTLVPTAQGWCP